MRPPTRLATPADLAQAASTLGAAFRDYAWTRWTVSGPDYESRVTELQRLFLEYVVLPNGTMWVDEHVTAVAAFLPPTSPGLPKSVRERILTLQGPEGRANQSAAAQVVAERAALVSEEIRAVCAEAWTLATVGVHPEHRGTGLGTAVLEAGLAHLDGVGASCRRPRRATSASTSGSVSP